MLCPVCDVDMWVLEFELVEIDYCPECGGVWLDSGELQLIGERAGALKEEFLEAVQAHAGARPQGASRPCPVCGRKMRELSTDTQPPITLDRCPEEHGLWFDRGELGSVVQAAGAKEGNVLARFFAELGDKGEPAANS